MLLFANGIYLTLLSVHLPDTLCPSQATAGVEAPPSLQGSAYLGLSAGRHLFPVRRHHASSACHCLVAGAPSHTGQNMPGHIGLRALGSGRD